MMCVVTVLIVNNGSFRPRDRTVARVCMSVFRAISRPNLRCCVFVVGLVGVMHLIRGSNVEWRDYRAICAGRSSRFVTCCVVGILILCVGCVPLRCGSVVALYIVEVIGMCVRVLVYGVCRRMLLVLVLVGGRYLVIGGRCSTIIITVM